MVRRIAGTTSVAWSLRKRRGRQWKSANSFSVIPLLTKSTKRYEEEEEELLERTREKPSWRSFSYSELVDATDNFNPENLLGIAGHAEVYKGHLPDGRIVAVKKIVSIDKEEDDQARDFLTELGIISHINHPNAAHLIGFGIDRGLHLVLEFSPYGYLTAMLFGSVCLDWKTRFKVAVGIAEGLKYLHHDCRRRIIHRDITASNILLTEDYKAQISDFGLAKWLPEQWHNHVVHHIEGTFGYLAPEYFMHGIVDEKTDVFAFGVLLLEIVTDNFDPNEMQRAMVAASMCISRLANMRQTMTKVVQLLKNEDEDGPVELHRIPCGRKAVIVDGSLERLQLQQLYK
ncbi:Receptor-like cytosolic serine/threonine-protein kinase RBK1 [Hibiscus syriacus]|uniref:non-specific serine/threonine protein kinase n=1 Tax=Hibiscus syriacus TaxID=106335 RepID=A0A6A2Y7W7_HIBSY|nr:Receptor-like cytosolic serine/threonine-protein kinase RBK1 [Hibiscus syriacus]